MSFTDSKSTMYYVTSPQTEQDEDVLVDDGSTYGWKLILYNDEQNTFEWVIQCLVEVCKHTFQQAEQCAIIVHFKGKYAVQEGIYEELKPQKDALADRGLNVTLESTEK